jgi:hypothetical protein
MNKTYKFTFKPCCTAIAEATSKGSDNEAWGKAIYQNEDTGAFTMGSVATEVKFCPFCGKKLKAVRKVVK